MKFELPVRLYEKYMLQILLRYGIYRLTGVVSVEKKYSVYGFKGKFPVIPESCTIFENVTICGDVRMGENCVVMPGCVLRAEHNPIVIGNKTNIQDSCVIHVELGENGNVVIGNEVTIGHGAIIHGCEIKDRCIIGMGAVVQDEAVVERECLIGAGSVVTPRTVIPKGHLAVGVPAKVRRPLTEHEVNEIDIAVNEYQEYAEEYRKNNGTF